MTTRILISYRRDDSETHAGRLYDRLSARFGAAALFMDIDDIEPGQDFAQVIRDALRECAAAIVVVGPKWVDIRDGRGRRRLDDPADFVHIEVASALGSRLRVIPVLVAGAQMPAPAELPPPLAALATRNAVELRDGRPYRRDVESLIAALRPVRPAASPVPAGAWRAGLAGVAAVAGLAWLSGLPSIGSRVPSKPVVARADAGAPAARAEPVGRAPAPEPVRAAVPLAPAPTRPTVVAAVPPAGVDLVAHASAGNGVAQQILASRYLDGRDGVAQDHAQALHWSTKAAAQGNAVAARMLGQMHERGLGTPADAMKALHWYDTAARLGDRTAAERAVPLVAAVRRELDEKVARLQRDPPPADGASARNIEFERVKAEMHRLSEMQNALSNVLNTMNEQAMDAIRHIKV